MQFPVGINCISLTSEIRYGSSSYIIGMTHICVLEMTSMAMV